MNITNKNLLDIKGQIDYTLGNFRAKVIDVNKLDTATKQLKKLLAAEISSINYRLQSSKYPRSLAGYDKELIAIGEMQKLRAYSLHGSNIELIKAEMEKELSNCNYDFVFALAELVFASDKHKNADKAALSNIYFAALHQSEADKHLDNYMQSKVLMAEVEAIENNLSSEPAKLIENVNMVRSSAEIKYAVDKEKIEKVPPYQLYAKAV